MKDFLNNIFKDFKSSIAAKISAGLVFMVIMFSGFIWGIFKDGIEVRKYEEAEIVFDSIMNKKMKDPVYAGKVATTILKTPEVKVYAEKKSTETQKAVVELTEKDSINLRKELRLYMDLRESESVSKELAWTYIQMKRLPFLFDSIFTANRRRTPTSASVEN